MIDKGIFTQPDGRQMYAEHTELAWSHRSSKARQQHGITYCDKVLCIKYKDYPRPDEDGAL